jgi:hypothetical protein
MLGQHAREFRPDLVDVGLQFAAVHDGAEHRDASATLAGKLDDELVSDRKRQAVSNGDAARREIVDLDARGIPQRAVVKHPNRHARFKLEPRRTAALVWPGR